MMTQPDVTGFFDTATNTISYLVADPVEKRCAIIDSLLDFDQAAGRVHTTSADALIGFIVDQGLICDWIIDTHVHADHLSAATYIRSKIGGKTAISDKIPDVQRVFGNIFNEGEDFRTDGTQFDHLFSDGETYTLGSITAQTLHTPGHTPACMSHLIGDALFVGDTIFMPDFGTARCDFPGGDAGMLYDSIQKLFALPSDTRMFLCHDYKAPGRDDFAWESTVGTQKRSNIHVGNGISRPNFIAMRTKRDATLAMPKLILPSVQVNIRAGKMPDPEPNGHSYLKTPINVF